MTDTNQKIEQLKEDGWKVHRKKKPYYLYLRKEGEEIKVACATGAIVKSMTYK